MDFFEVWFSLSINIFTDIENHVFILVYDLSVYFLFNTELWNTHKISKLHNILNTLGRVCKGLVITVSAIWFRLSLPFAGAVVSMRNQYSVHVRRGNPHLAAL